MLKIVIALLCILIVLIFCTVNTWRKYEIKDRVQVVPVDYGRETESDLVEIKKKVKVEDELNRMSVENYGEVE